MCIRDRDITYSVTLGVCFPLGQYFLSCLLPDFISHIMFAFLTVIPEFAGLSHADQVLKTTAISIKEMVVQESVNYTNCVHKHPKALVVNLLTTVQISADQRYENSLIWHTGLNYLLGRPTSFYILPYVSDHNNIQC